MRITTRLAFGASGLALLMGATAASAQAQQAAEQAPTVVVNTGGQASASHRFGDPIDSGSTVIGDASIEDRAPGSGDVNEVLKVLPTVQFSASQGRATRADLQDLRPEDLSISGGSPFENLFVLDGVSVNSRLDVTSTNAGHYIEGNAAASAQSVWVDAGLVGSLTVRDSNVSARYGQFTGGVVEINTRRPRSSFGVSTHYGETSPGLASFRVSDRVRDSLNGVLPEEPDYEKRRYGVSLDLPISDTVRTLAAYSLTESTVTNYRGANWLQYGDYGLTSRSENFMLKAEADLPSEVLLTGQLTWSPYESRSSHANGIDNYVTLNGGGLTAKVGLEGRLGDGDWSLELSHAYSNTDRDSDNPGTVNVTTDGGSGIDFCSGTSCSLGGPGILEQSQSDTALEGTWEQPVGQGVFRAGFKLANIEGEKAQPYSAAFRHVSTNAYPTIPNEVNRNVVCADPAEREAGTCVDGRYALAQRNDTTAFDTKVDLTAASLWGEYETALAGFVVRAGLRYDYESFLGNHDFAPRLSVTRDLPAGLVLTLGANRYYGRSFLGYALRENYPGNRIYQRRPTVVGTQQIWSDNWYLVSHTETARYSDANLDTPFSDEFTVALQGRAPWIGGEVRLKGILREGKNEFSSSRSTSEVYDRETGGTSTRQVYTITNDGGREYKGLSLEYLREFGQNHSVSFSTNWSKTSASNTNYFDLADETEFEGVLVYFRGELRPQLEVTSQNQLEDFASPLILNADWSARWFGGRLRTNLNARWRDGFERIDDTGANITLNGARYDVYDTVRYAASVTANLGAVFQIAQTSWGEAVLDVRVNNLFDAVTDQDYSNTAQPYQMGRNAWVSLKYRY